jgi:hypothetical protein
MGTDLTSIPAPFEAFYIEAMLFCTTAVLNAEAEVNAALAFAASHQAESFEWQEGARAAIDGVQEIVLQAAALSRFFWPPGRASMHRDRGTQLRSAFGLTDSSPLRNRDLRNQLEHLDEHLDRFSSSFSAGVVFPTWLGAMPVESGVPTVRFRAYYTDVGVLEVMGRRYHIVPLLEEVRRIHVALVSCTSNGHRLPVTRRAGA